jgi:hypothetical protein
MENTKISRRLIVKDLTRTFGKKGNPELTAELPQGNDSPTDKSDESSYSQFSKPSSAF